MEEVQRYHQLRRIVAEEVAAERDAEADRLAERLAASRHECASPAQGRESAAADAADAEPSDPAAASAVDDDSGRVPSAFIEDFKRDVRAWMDLDTVIKNLAAMIKDRRAHKKELTDRIVRFMNAHQIDDLDTKEGNIRSRVSYVKVPLSQRMIREGLRSYFAHNEALAAQVMTSVFNRDRPKVEKMSLRLLNDAGRV